MKKGIALIILFVMSIAAFYIRTVAYYNDRREVFYKLQNSLEDFGGDVAVYYKDLDDGFEYYFNPDKLYPSASLVKIPVMAAVFRAVEEQKLSLDQKIKYHRRHRAGGAGSLRRMRSGRKFSIGELTYRMIVESDNVATNMLCEVLGLGYINLCMIEWGLNVTDMKRWVMDLRRRNSGIENYTTAREMGFLLEQIYKGEIVSRQSCQQMLEIMKRQKHRDRIARYLPTEVTVANKTGLMRDVVHDVGVIYTPKGDYVLCVLTRNLSTAYAKRLIGEISYIIYDLHISKKDTKLTGIIQ